MKKNIKITKGGDLNVYRKEKKGRIRRQTNFSI